MSEYGTMNVFGMGFGWIIPILFIVLIIYFINNVVKSDSSAKDILDKRYANGEIDENEYREKKRALES